MVGVGNTAEVFDHGDGKVCKLFFAGYPKDAVEREFRNATEVQKLSLPVPKVYETIVLESRNGIVYEKIEGKSLLDCIFENTGEAATCLEQFVRLQKEWLTVCSDAVVSYKEFLRGMVRGNGQAEAALLDEIDALPEGNVLLHGDFHPGNVLITPNNRAVVIDFMNVCRGPALYDVARTYFLLKEKDDFFGTAYLAMMDVAEEKIEMFYSVIERCRMYER